MNRMKRTKTSSWVVALTAAAALAFLIPAASAAPDPFTPVQPAANDSSELPAVGTVTRQFTQNVAGHQRTAVVGGVLTAATTQPPQAVGASYLAARPDVLNGVDPAQLTISKVIDFSNGHGLRYKQSFRGLPVYGGTTVVRLDAQRRVRWAGSNARPIPEDLDIEPTLTAVEAATAAATLVGYDHSFIDRLDMANTAQLAIYSQPNMDSPRLAYWIELPTDMARMAVYRAFVDAHTGHVYKAENRVVRGNLPTCAPGTKRAYVYPTNPVETPDLECVSLEPYLDGAATQLQNEDIATGNCVDDGSCRTVEVILPVDVHWCNDAPLASTNAGGDFLDHQYTNDTDPEDAFAEVQMFYHLNIAFDKARAMGGFTNLNARPLGAAVNFRLPIDIATGDILGLLNRLCTNGAYTGGEPLLPFDNAAFIPAGGLLGYPDTDGLVFGQGTTADFAYDGDVVYHEFGHALMNTVAPGLTFGIFDQYGYDPMPGGMHEGYADLLTLWVTDDPEVGEYTGTALGVPGGAIRNVNNDHSCPRNLVNQVHEDSLPITGAIYEAREAIANDGGDKAVFDVATFAAQQLFTETDNYETAAAKTIVEVEAAMGATHAATLSGVLSDRGISDCNNRTISANDGYLHPLFLAGSLQGAAMGILPGAVQWSYDLPNGADSITLDIDRAQYLGAALGGGDPVLSIGLKQGSHIMWNDSGSGPMGDYSSSAQVAFTIDPNTGVGPGTVTLNGPFTPGTYYLQLFVEGGSVFMADVGISHVGGAPPDAGVTPDADMGGQPDAAGPDPEPDDGCGCVVGHNGSSPAGGVLLTLLGMFAIVLIRRRR